MTRHRLLLWVMILLCASSVQAGSQVWIRLVSASHTGKGAPASVRDVADALKKSFVYDTYDLLASGTIPLPANGATVQMREYTVTCTGEQTNMRIHVAHGRNTILNTTVNLPNRKPLILGGFPARDGTRILVFLAR